MRTHLPSRELGDCAMVESPALDSEASMLRLGSPSMLLRLSASPGRRPTWCLWTDHGPGDDGPVVVAPGLGAAPRVQRPLATAGTLASAWFS